MNSNLGSDQVVVRTDTWPASQGIYESQRPLYELMRSTLANLRRNYWNPRHVAPMLLISSIGGFLFGLLLATLITWSAHKTLATEWAIYAASLALVGITLAVAAFRKWGWLRAIEYHDGGDPSQWLEFHHLDVALGVGFGAYVVMMTASLGIYTQLIYQTHDHCGLPFAPSWWSSFTMAATNFLDTITLGASKAGGFQLGERPMHTGQSAAIFALFQFTYSAHAGILLVALWRRRRVTHLMQAYDRFLTQPTPEGMKAYLAAVCHRDKNWVRSFHNEFLFFWLVERCLARRYDECRALRDLFPDLDIPPAAFELFRDGNGRPVFRSVTSGPQD